MSDELTPSTASKKIRRLAQSADQILISFGCIRYRKTIYVGYEFKGAMVAAMYVRRDLLEIPLALPEDFDGALIEDAGHLTWRTLPVAVIVRSEEDLQLFSNYAHEAFARVSSKNHKVRRDNTYFAKSRRERKGPGFSIRRPPRDKN
jgi:hypothetical protein